MVRSRAWPTFKTFGPYGPVPKKKEWPRREDLDDWTELSLSGTTRGVLSLDTVEGEREVEGSRFSLVDKYSSALWQGLFQSKTNVANDEMFLYFAGGYSGLSQLRTYQVFQSSIVAMSMVLLASPGELRQRLPT